MKNVLEHFKVVGISISDEKRLELPPSLDASFNNGVHSNLFVRREWRAMQCVVFMNK